MGIVDLFAWAPSVPRDMFEDKEFLYSVLPAEWENMVREYDGVRLPGPVNIQAIEYGGIDDQSGQEIVMRPDSPLWTYVIVRISGPAMRL